MKSRKHPLIIVIAVMLALVTSLAGCMPPVDVTPEESQASSSAEDTKPKDPNAENYARLLTDLSEAYEKPAQRDNKIIADDLAAIGSVSEEDREVAQAIADQWNATYLNPDHKLRLYSGMEWAPELNEAGITDDSSHAFVILGYELKNGEMTDELKGRCDVAAAAARTFPNTIIVCTGGATGSNNPKKHTEAGLMKDYLVNNCEIEASRIYTDDSALTTAENAQNTFEIMRDNGVKTMTIITSSYHQRWAQAVYNALAALYKRDHDYSVEIVGDYSLDIEPENEVYRKDNRIAVHQIAELLGLPESVMKTLPEFGPTLPSSKTTGTESASKSEDETSDDTTNSEGTDTTDGTTDSESTTDSDSADGTGDTNGSQSTDKSDSDKTTKKQKGTKATSDDEASNATDTQSTGDASVTYTDTDDTWESEGTIGTYDVTYDEEY